MRCGGSNCWAGILGAVVVLDLDVDARPLGKAERLLEEVAALPVEIPAGDAEHALLLSVRKRGGRRHALTEEVRMASNRDDLEVDGNLKALLEHKISFTRGQPQPARRPYSGGIWKFAIRRSGSSF